MELDYAPHGLSEFPTKQGVQENKLHLERKEWRNKASEEGKADEGWEKEKGKKGKKGKKRREKKRREEKGRERERKKKERFNEERNTEETNEQTKKDIWMDGWVGNKGNVEGGGTSWGGRCEGMECR